MYIVLAGLWFVNIVDFTEGPGSLSLHYFHNSHNLVFHIVDVFYTVTKLVVSIKRSAVLEILVKAGRA